MKIFAFLFLFLIQFPTFAQADHVLHYKQPAEYFEEALVLGNGKMGASVHGGIGEDKIYLNDITLWAGEPVNPFMNKEAYKHLPDIQRALRNEDYKTADSLQHFLQGSFSESFAPLGTLFIRTNSENFSNYSRSLDLSSALSETTYENNGTRFRKEYFTSNPAQLMVIRYSAEKMKKVSFQIDFDSKLKLKNKENEGNTLVINGYAPYHAEPNYRSEISNGLLYDENRGTRFTAAIRLINVGGKIVRTDSTIGVENANEVTILVSLATSFNGYDKNPATEGLDNDAIAKKQLNDAENKSFAQLKAEHLADYQPFYDRVKLKIGKSTSFILPTDERLKRYAKGEEDFDLETLYFNFGRYLLISSSRTLGVPANLQGLWNPYERPPWSSNYTTNINAEMNYWPAELCNLSELHLPLLTFIENVSKKGKITAQTFYGARGWCLAHNSDIWAMSNPVGDFGKGDPVWANWNMGGTWISTHLWEHFMFTQDTSFLAKNYDIMKNAAVFCLDMLVHDTQGNLVTSPSTSPENKYKTPEGYIGATLFGGTADLAMIRELFQETIRAAEVLDKDMTFRKTLQTTLERLYPYQISKKYGYLQEWYYDWDDQDPQHRHQSHLFGLYPGHHISLEKTPILAEACKQTLLVKGDETTGWSKGWRTNLWARLHDGNHTYKMYRELLRYIEPDGKRTKNVGGGTYPNLFDAHPPFQIDGNFGGTAAVVEMLMQSEENIIEFLPALPDAWTEGRISGIKARGGFEISMEWSGGILNKVKIKSKNGGKTTLKYKTKTMAFL